MGHVGNAEDSLENGSGDWSRNPEDFYTDPDQAREYVRLTSADALAVAVGTLRGTYKSQPKLDYNRIGEITKAVGIPLVLHGGSGLSEEAFSTAISHGICKVNIFTDINGAMTAGARQALKSGKAFGTDLILSEIEHIKQAAAAKMKIFACCGKAG